MYILGKIDKNIVVVKKGKSTQLQKTTYFVRFVILSIRITLYFNECPFLHYSVKSIRKRLHRYQEKRERKRPKGWVWWTPEGTLCVCVSNYIACVNLGIDDICYDIIIL